MQFIRPSSPVEKAHIESLNGRLREKCLNQRAFISLDNARERIEAWRVDYNTVRPHSTLGQLAPNQFQHCINRKPARYLTCEWCTRWGKVTRTVGAQLTLTKTLSSHCADKKQKARSKPGFLLESVELTRLHSRFLLQ
ncbi:integrase core domain-containing protein [Paraburkholderia bonniea]|uniref:integrase core domain-containing protein n=1 Tax=Paraburkholderia bonniea TaxID=2152891 RepID=UPI001291235E